jgi:hypothetical protein
MTVVQGIPAPIVNLIQQGALERAFHDGLFPSLLYRQEALREEWPANTGEEVFMTRPGLLRPVTRPLVPGTDPVPQSIQYEQWVARLDRFAGTIDTHMPTSAVANTNQFMRNVNQLGLQAGQSLNRIPRNALFTAYLSGWTAISVAAGAGDLSIQVASLNGFTDVVLIGSTVRPVPVSGANPLPITINNGAVVTRNVIGAVPNDVNDPLGPGVLLLSVAVGGAGAAARSPVLSSARPKIVRTGGGDTVDAIGAGDTLVLQDIINAANLLRASNVQPHEDGWYHAHISPGANTQLFADPVWQRLHQSLPDHDTYKMGFLGVISGVAFYMNNESPDPLNSGDRVGTGVLAFYSNGIHAETTNETNVNIGRVLVTGKGVMYERYLDESNYVSEAGIMGKIGEFDIINNGVAISTELIRLILRAPIDRLQDIVAASWSISTSFPIPSDVSAGGPERFKRAIVIEHAA